MKQPSRFVFAIVLLLGCATTGSGPPSVAFRIAGNVPDATVWIDDHLVGKLADFSKSEKRLERRLILGFHRVEIRAPGYYSVFRELEAKAGADLSIEADLHELLQ
jgi:hypothetical protein